MKFIGIKYVEGYKNYSNPFKRVRNHPTIVFYDGIKKQFYFINFSSLKENVVRDILRQNGKPIIFVAHNVKKERFIEKEHKMNLMVSIARCDASYVSTLENPALEGQIYINNNYVCSDYDKLLNDTYCALVKYYDELFIYNGNDDNYQSPDLEDSSLPKDLLTTFKQNLKK